VHQRQEVAPELATIGMAGKHLLRVRHIDREFSFPRMVTSTAERAVEAHVVAVALDIERHAALRRGVFERGLSLQFVDVDVARSQHEKSW